MLALRLEMLGDVIAKLTPLLATGPSLTTTFPVVAPVGTKATMLVWLQLIVVAGRPLKATVLGPCAGPKFVPVMVTEVPAGPETGFRPAIVTGVTTKFTLLLGKPPTVTTTGPVVAPGGTDTVIPVSIQLLLFTTVVPLNVTVSPGTNAPKFVPKIVTDIPIGPEFGYTCVTVGVTVKGTELKPSEVVTTTVPVVAPAGTWTTMPVSPQLVGVAPAIFPSDPTKETVLLPCVAPKFVPEIVTEAPTGPKLGLTFEIIGDVTVKTKPLLATPPTVTTTLPVVAP